MKEENLEAFVKGRNSEFRIDGHLFSTRTTDVYRGVREQTGEEVCLHLLRYPLSDPSSGEQRFRNRIERLLAIGVLGKTVLDAGVDSQGRPYVATTALVGQPLVEIEATPTAREALFLRAVKVVALIHENNLHLGDICDQSFFVDNSGDLELVAFLGVHDVEAEKTALLPPASTLHYLSPEEMGGSRGHYPSDVYALGVLGYRLFTGRHMFGERSPGAGNVDINKVPAPSVVNGNVPIWGDDIIGTCVIGQLSARYKNAGELLDVIERAIQFGSSPGGSGPWSRRTVAVRTDLQGTLSTAKKSVSETFPLSSEQQRSTSTSRSKNRSEERQSKFSLGAFFVVLLGLTVGGSLFLLSEEEPSASPYSELPFQLSDIPTELQGAVKDFYDINLPVEQRILGLEAVAKSKDPIVLPVLVSAVKQNEESLLKKSAERIVVERVRDQKLLRTASFIERWFQAMAHARLEPGKSPLYPFIIRASLDTLPLEARRNALHKIYAEEPTMALQMAAALSLDDTGSQHFTPVLSQLLSVQMNRKDLRDKEVGALIISYSPLAMFFDSEITEMLDSFSSADLVWGMVQLANTDSSLLFQVAEEVRRRGIVPPFEGVFLSTLLEVNRYSLSRRVKSSLVRGMRGELDDNDINSLGRWESPAVEPVLLAACASARERSVAVSAFDTLAARSLETQPAKSLVTWVKRRHWDARERIVKAIGIFGHLDISSSEQLEYALDLLMPFSGSGNLLKAVLSSKNASLIELAIDRLSETTPSDVFLSLLSHEAKGVRIASIKALVGRNELGVLQGIVQAYENERDSSVREVYRRLHWVTKER